MSAAASDFWSSKQALDKEIHQRLFKDFSERCEAFPIEKMSTEDIQGSTLYGTTKKDFYFSTGAHETFENIMRTLRYFPVNQVHLRMWRHWLNFGEEVSYLPLHHSEQLARFNVLTYLKGDNKDPQMIRKCYNQELVNCLGIQEELNLFNSSEEEIEIPQTPTKKLFI